MPRLHIVLRPRVPQPSGGGGCSLQGMLRRFVSGCCSMRKPCRQLLYEAKLSLRSPRRLRWWSCPVGWW